MSAKSKKTNPAQSRSTGRRPTHRAWIVTDQPDTGKALWREVTGLWPTKKGSGLSGSVPSPVTLADGVLSGRLVVLPARMRPDQPEGEAGSEGGEA